MPGVWSVHAFYGFLVGPSYSAPPSHPRDSFPSRLGFPSRHRRISRPRPSQVTPNCGVCGAPPSLFTPSVLGGKPSETREMWTAEHGALVSTGKWGPDPLPIAVYGGLVVRLCRVANQAPFTAGNSVSPHHHEAGERGLQSPHTIFRIFLLAGLARHYWPMYRAMESCSLDGHTSSQR